MNTFKACWLVTVLYLGFASLTARAEIPSVDPETALVVTSCNLIVTVVVVMPNGKAIFYDNRSAESADVVKQFASRSRQPARVYEVGCFKGDDNVAT